MTDAVSHSAHLRTIGRIDRFESQAMAMFLNLSYGAIEPIDEPFTVSVVYKRLCSSGPSRPPRLDRRRIRESAPPPPTITVNGIPRTR